jgi:hypothetical protein
MIFSHVLYQLSYLAYRNCCVDRRADARLPQKTEYNTQVLMGTVVVTAEDACLLVSNSFRFAKTRQRASSSHCSAAPQWSQSWRSSAVIHASRRSRE